MGNKSAFFKTVESMSFWERFKLDKGGFFFSLFSRDIEQTGYDVSKDESKDSSVVHHRSDNERWNPAEDSSKRISDKNSKIDGGTQND